MIFEVALQLPQGYRTQGCHRCWLESRLSGNLFPRLHVRESPTWLAPRGQDPKPKVAGFEAEAAIVLEDGGLPDSHNSCGAAHGTKGVARGWVAPPGARRRHHGPVRARLRHTDLRIPGSWRHSLRSSLGSCCGTRDGCGLDGATGAQLGVRKPSL
jgi:hypothetical protein